MGCGFGLWVGFVVVFFFLTGVVLDLNFKYFQPADVRAS